MSSPPMPRTQAAKQEQYVLEQLETELSQPWVVLSAVLVLALILLFAWRWIRRLPRDARSTPRWRYVLYGLLLAGGLAFALGLPGGFFRRGGSPQGTQAAGSELASDQAPVKAPPLPEVPFSGELFRKLTWAPWIDVECEREGKTDINCWPWVFFPEGTYGRSAHPMAVKNRRIDSYAKSWDMRASSESTGVIATEEGDFMPFELKSDDQLLLAGRLYRRSEETLEGVEKLALRKKHVSPLGILKGHELLLKAPWTKVNAFDADVMPTSITFVPDGRIKAAYRGGGCVHEATFTVKSKRLSIEWGNNPCADEARRPARTVTAEYPEWFRGELLMLDDAYRPETGPTAPPEVLVGFRGMSSVLKGQFSRELRKGAPIELRLTFESQFPLAKLEPGELWIWLRQAPSKGDEPRPRREQVLFSKDLRSVPLEQLGRQYAERVTVTPEFSGPGELEFELMFPKAGEGWQKRMQRVYAVEVAE